MTGHTHFARSLRLHRLHHHSPSGLMVTPLDHGISDGPVVPAGLSFDQLAGQLAAAGVDAAVVHKGRVRHIRPERFARMSLIIHLNASSRQAPDPDAKYLVTAVEDAVRLGADAVSIHVNLGSQDERQQIADLGRVADACERWNLPLMAMMYPRGPHIGDPRDPALVEHAVAIAVELGADLVKTVFPDSVPDMLRLTASCPVPLLAAGGPARADRSEVVEFVDTVLSGGAVGVAMGRNIVQSASPEQLAGTVAGLVHARRHPDAMTGEEHHDRRQTLLA
ncbi:2-amino-3,7-dideoxy-D-threo-hept-6-ulosonate synthase [Streptomonospora algeriensis]|uniref:2-amino-3,7-dideoxy-D-threo-hept-6-ulosonate synthase n=1 Tax=Streptomonospora algeriensis TaxID=995084 RepID=A0ABW3BEQ5_9ACTN